MLHLDERLAFLEEPVSIFARDVKRLHSRDILVVKVHWCHLLVEEATWKFECDPYLFEPLGIFLYLTFVNESPCSSGCCN